MHKPTERIALNFTYGEFACKCGCGFGLRDGDIDPALVQAVQLIRTIVQQPVRINSGCRCIAHNRNVGGSLRSQHTLGKAADITTGVAGPRTVARLADIALTIPVFNQGGIIQYPNKGFVHVDTRGHPFHAVNI
jgi:uncharacterized protein YcbK (DUF882 family)